MDPVRDFTVSLLIGRWNFWMGVPSLSCLCEKLHRQPWTPCFLLRTSQTSLCPWSSAPEEDRCSSSPRLLSGICKLICPAPYPTPPFSFLSFLEGVKGLGNREGQSTPRVISHFPQHFLGFPFLSLIIQSVPVCVDLRLLEVAIRH